MRITIEIAFTDDTDGSERTANGIGVTANAFENAIKEALGIFEATSLPGIVPWHGMDYEVKANEFSAREEGLQ